MGRGIEKICFTFLQGSAHEAASQGGQVWRDCRSTFTVLSVSKLFSIVRQQIAAHRDELRRSAEALKEAVRRKDEFLATLAHELRNPLTPISNGLQILRKSPHGRDGDTIREMMERQVTHLIRLVDDLLDVSRVSQGKIDLRRAQIEAQTIPLSAIEVSTPVIDAGRHQLTVDMPEEPILLDADLVRIVSGRQ